MSTLPANKITQPTLIQTKPNKFLLVCYRGRSYKVILAQPMLLVGKYRILVQLRTVMEAILTSSIPYSFSAAPFGAHSVRRFGEFDICELGEIGLQGGKLGRSSVWEINNDGEVIGFCYGVNDSIPIYWEGSYDLFDLLNKNRRILGYNHHTLVHTALILLQLQF